ncbi:unnamed protein product [Adineta steineri]|uniref:SCP domain-containing protein n=1 Tax=Adineta steineri TaxID=433720 RepID=A0A814R4H0_9BILA|nr:unnamed protein product [Adineta steineri]CAF4090514.1 unnamed protein product [Adineta steineri]
MNRNNNTASSRSNNDGHSYYKITRTVTNSDGKKQTETVEMVDDDAIKHMQNLRLQHDDKRDENRFGFHSLRNPKSLFRSTKPTADRNATATAAVQDNTEFAQEALKLHNELRRKHGVEPLKLNNDLSKLAQDWANHLASTRGLVHSKTKYRNTQVGENLYCQSWPLTGKEMTQSWYNECKKYDYHNRQLYQSDTGHFTQVVWKNSQEVGFAQAQGSSMNFAVAMYYPAGNFLGEFDKNVFPPS